jgi:dTDP-4-dehydrorhamnose reductase
MINNKKIYIAGAGGMLGEAFYKVFGENNHLLCSDKDLNEKWINFVDFRDASSYKDDVYNFKPDYLFHLGAHTSLEYCEENPDDAYATNTLPVETAVNIANKLKIPILYISTAGIFDGKQDTYDDWDTPNPLGHYARSKYMGERYVIENSTNYLVCRAGWMMGGGPQKDKKFIQKLINQIKSGVKELYVVDDKLGTPTYTCDFAKNVELLLFKELWGVYNMVCGGITGRLEVANELINLLGLDLDIKVNPVKSDYFSEEYFAARPASERLITKKLNLQGANIMRDWKTCLKEYLEEYYKGYF